MSSSLPLDVQEFSCFYGKKCAVDRASVAVRENEVVALIGANGAGKSSLLRGIIGLNPAVTGTVRVFGNKQHRAEPSKLARLGVALMPQENGVFGQLSLADNLATARFSAADGDLPARIRAAQEMFPFDLGFDERGRELACHLSGGQRRILSLAMVFAANPRILLLDEPTLGLSAKNTRVALEAVAAFRKKTGAAFLIVEHKSLEVLSYADRAYFMRLGRIVHEGEAKTLLHDRKLLAELYGLPSPSPETGST
jgi:branched-chain amino acid transport system ATP-binding protein